LTQKTKKKRTKLNKTKLVVVAVRSILGGVVAEGVAFP